MMERSGVARLTKDHQFLSLEACRAMPSLGRGSWDSAPDPWPPRLGVGVSLVSRASWFCGVRESSGCDAEARTYYSDGIPNL